MLNLVIWALADVFLASVFAESVLRGAVLYLATSVGFVLWDIFFHERHEDGDEEWSGPGDDRPWLYFAWPLFVVAVAWGLLRPINPEDEDDDEPPSGERPVTT